MWTVEIPRKTKKQIDRLPANIQDSLKFLLREIRISGPVRGNWPNYSKLGKGAHHCHIKKGKPTYVAVWQEIAGAVRLVEVTYVGTHEKAPY